MTIMRYGGFRVGFPDGSVTPPGVSVRVRRYKSTDRGGPDTAELEASGQSEALWLLLSWLGKNVEITNPNGSRVWYGFVSEIVIGLGGYSLGASLDDMANRVAVAYTTKDASGASVGRVSSWAQNDESVATFGTKELILSIGDSSDAMATAKALELLAQSGWPAGVPSISPATGATIRCRGAIHGLDWRYYSNPAGRIENVPSSGSSSWVAVGWYLATDEVGFAGEAIHEVGGLLTGPQPGDRLLIGGTTTNPGAVVSVSSATSDEPVSLTSTNISFDPADDIRNSSNLFSTMRDGHWMEITGSAQNTGFWYIERIESANHMEIGPGVSGDTITGEVSGPSITIRLGTRLPLASPVANQKPGSGTTTVTLYGHIVAQSFVAPASITTGQLSLRLGKHGSPSDSLQVRLMTNSAGAPGSALATVTVSGSSLYDDLFDTWIDLPAVALSSGSTYWLEINRTGAVSASDYYLVGVSSDAYGSTLAWTGAGGWAPFLRDGESVSIPFRLWDSEDTSLSIARIIQLCGQSFVDGLRMDTTGVARNQYVDELTTGLTELRKLLEAGTASGERLVAVVQADGTLSVEPEPARDAVSSSTLHVDGLIHEATGARWEDGRLPVGVWINLAGLPDAINSQWQVSPVFVVESSYDVGQRKLTIKPRGSRQPLTFMGIG